MKFAGFLIAAAVLALALSPHPAQGRTPRQVTAGTPGTVTLTAIVLLTPAGTTTVTPLGTTTATPAPETPTPTPGAPPTSTPVPPTPTSTARPAPTPTRTPAGPSARQVVGRVYGAIQHAGSFHVVFYDTVAGSDQSSSFLQITGDFSLRKQQIHTFQETISTTIVKGHKKTIPIRQEIRRVGQELCTWTAGKWHPQRQSGTIPLPPYFANLSGGNVKKAALGRPVTIRGTRAWTVAVQTAHALQRPQPIPATLYIAHSTYLLLRETISYSEKVGKVTTHLDGESDYTRYGERFSVQLPRACQGH